MMHLHKDVITNVLRHLSARPRDPKWQKFVSHQDALSVRQSDTPLAPLAGALFNDLKIVLVNDCTDDLSKCERQFPASRLQHLIETFPGSLTHIKITNREVGPGKDYAEGFIFDYDAYHARNYYMHASAADDALSNVFNAQSGKVESLQIMDFINFSRYIPLIAVHCHGLRRLELSMFKFTDLDLEPVWPTVGPTLTDVCFSPFAHPVSEQVKDDVAFARILVSVRKHCRALKKVAVYEHYEHSIPVLVDLCKSLGSQLEFLILGVRRLSPPQLREIAQGCPNVLVRTKCKGKATASSLIALGDRANDVQLNSSFPCDDELRLASIAISNVSRISYTFGDELVAQTLGILLDEPKIHLRSLSLSGMNDFPKSCTQDILAVLKNQAKNLSSLTLQIPFLPASAFEELFGPECVLEEVILCFEDEEHNARSAKVPSDEDEELALMTTLIGSSKSVLDLDISVQGNHKKTYLFPHVRDACSKLRRQKPNLSVTICRATFL